MKTVNERFSAEAVTSPAGTSILVVDDEIAVRRFAVRVLEREGYVVVEARDGVDALELLKESITVDVVVSDIVMPRLNGVEMMQALGISHPGLPVILMSGYATGALVELGIAAPCAILPKPFASDRLLEEVRRCIKQRDRN
ncbi:MAG TPA: response regulator [Gemmatimonadales bacterium]|jgi:DNA-binding NtrC family response regulator